MSFFDDLDDKPRTRSRPRIPAGAGRGGPPAHGGADRDSQTLLVRRAVALGLALILLVLLVVIVKGCVDSQAEQSLKDYNRNVADLAAASDRDVAAPLLTVLSSAASKTQQEAQNAVLQYRVAADQQIKRAEGFDVPDEVVEAQRDFLLVLELRRDAVAGVAAQIQPALAKGSGAAAATRLIAGKLQNFLASDVIFSQRVFPLIRNALTAKGIAVGGTGEPVPQSRSLTDLGWLNPSFVAGKLGSTGTTGPSGPVAPGIHGHSLESVSVGNITLQPGGNNRVPAAPLPVFAVKFANGGDNDETNVRIRLRISAAGVKTINLTHAVARTPKHSTVTAMLGLTSKPPTGSVVNVRVTIVGVPGEKNLDNNVQTYPVLFTTG